MAIEMDPAAVESLSGSGHRNAWYGIAESSRIPVAYGTGSCGSAAAFAGTTAPENTDDERFWPAAIGVCASTCSRRTEDLAA